MKTSWFKRLFDYLRGHRGEKREVKLYPNTYQVMVSLDHPRIIGHIITCEVRIDAHDKRHARMQLARELQVKIGKARRA